MNCGLARNVGQLVQMKPCFVLLASAILVTGCRAVRQAELPAQPYFRIVTYNVNWGAPRPELAVEILKHSEADIICLQETTPEWEQFLRRELEGDYPLAEFGIPPLVWEVGWRSLPLFRCGRLPTFRLIPGGLTVGSWNSRLRPGRCKF
jgi:hypothetical protein